MKYRVQNSCSQGHTQSVVDECEEEILSNVAHRALAQPASFDDASEIAFY
jgi:hypothetical protein